MAGNYHSCDVNELLKAAKCFLQCVSQEDMRAARIYVRILDLVALGGTDYSSRSGLQTLLNDAKCWICSPTLNDTNREALDLLLDYQKALDDGVTTPEDEVRDSAYCYRCLDSTTKRNLLLFLQCLINAQEQARI